MFEDANPLSNIQFHFMNNRHFHDCLQPKKDIKNNLIINSSSVELFF